MPDWTRCPICDLRHVRRPSGLCPRCHRSQTEPAGAGAPVVVETANGSGARSRRPLAYNLAWLAARTRTGRAVRVCVGLLILAGGARCHSLAPDHADRYQARLDPGYPSIYVNSRDKREHWWLIVGKYRRLAAWGMLLGAGVVAGGLLVRRNAVSGELAVDGYLDVPEPVRELARALEPVTRPLAARLRAAASGKVAAVPADWLTWLMVVFTLMLAASVVQGIALQPERAPPASTLDAMLGLELLDTLLVCVAWGMARRRVPLWAPSRLPAWAAWCAGVGTLLLALGLNWSYHEVLIEYLDIAPPHDYVVGTLGYTPLVILAYCIQPAIVEELFFRWLAFDALGPLVGGHATVMLTAVMFGAAHVGVPLSIPVLMLVGVGLGYARMASGGLVLPMLIHFAHNLTVMLRT